MKIITRKIYLTKESINLIDNDINAKSNYTIFSNKEEGTLELDMTLHLPEEFLITEDVLLDIIAGLLPALDEKAHNDKLQMVLNHLRSLGSV